MTSVFSHIWKKEYDLVRIVSVSRAFFAFLGGQCKFESLYREMHHKNNWKLSYISYLVMNSPPTPPMKMYQCCFILACEAQPGGQWGHEPRPQRRLHRR